MRSGLTRSALILAAAVAAACASDAGSVTGGNPGNSDFKLTRVGGNAVPALDSGDSVAIGTGGVVEYREIYLERGSLTFSQDSQRFESVLHYAQYAVTTGTDGQRHLDLRGVVDFEDHGVVTHDAQGNLLLQSDLEPSVVHVATADSDGYTVQYHFPNVTFALVLAFRPEVR